MRPVLILSQGRALAEGAPRALIAERLAPERWRWTPSRRGGALAAGSAWQRLRSGRRLVIYADSADPVIARIRAEDGGDGRPLVVRPTNLEDVSSP